FNESRNIGHDELPVTIDIHNAEIRMFGREWIVGDCRPGPRQSREERAFPGVRFADQAHVGNDLELEYQFTFFAFAAGRRIARRAVHGAFEMRVSFARGTAAGGNDAVAVMRQIFESETFLGINDKGPWRHFDDKVCGATALLVRPTAGRTTGGPPKAVMSQRRQIIHAILSYDHHAAALAAIAPVRTAVWHVLFAPEADASVAGVASLNFYRVVLHQHNLWIGNLLALK